MKGLGAHFNKRALPNVLPINLLTTELRRENEPIGP